MTKQTDLFLPGVATVRTRQPDLYERLAVEVGFNCETCGRPMIRTAGGYAVCPRGHGRLHLLDLADEPGSGLWFGDDLTGNDE